MGPTAEPFTQLPFVAADGMITRRCSPWEGDVGEPAFGCPHQSRVLGLVEKVPSNGGMVRSSGSSRMHRLDRRRVVRPGQAGRTGGAARLEASWRLQDGMNGEGQA